MSVRVRMWGGKEEEEEEAVEGEWGGREGGGWVVVGEELQIKIVG